MLKSDFVSSESNSKKSLGVAAKIAQLPMPRRPCLPKWLNMYDLGDDRLQLASPTFSHTITYPLFIEVFQKILPLLDGKHEVEDIIQVSSGIALSTTTKFLIKSLYASGVIYEGDSSLYPPTNQTESWEAHAEYFATFTSDPIPLIANLASSTIITFMPCQIAKMLEANLLSLGIEKISHLNTARPSELETTLENLNNSTRPLLIVALESHQRHLFRYVNDLCLKYNTRWLHIRGNGSHIIFGPTFVPYQSACYTCFRYRINSQLPSRLCPDRNQEFYDQYNCDRVTATFTPLWNLAFAYAAMEGTRLLTGYSSPTTIGRSHEISGSTMTFTSHNVLKLPRCPSCGVAYIIE